MNPKQLHVGVAMLAILMAGRLCVGLSLRIKANVACCTEPLAVNHTDIVDAA